MDEPKCHNEHSSKAGGPRLYERSSLRMVNGCSLLLMPANGRQNKSPDQIGRGFCLGSELIVLRSKCAEAAFCFLRPRKPRNPRPPASKGSVAGSGVFDV